MTGTPLPARQSAIDAAVFALLVVFALCSAFSIAITQIGFFSALGLWFTGMLLRRRLTWPRTPLDLFFLAYAGVEVLATVFSVDPLYSLLYLQRRLLLLPLVYLIVANVRTEIQAKVLLGGMILSAVGVALYSLIPLAAHFTDYLLFRRRLGEFQIYMTAGGIQMIALLLLVPFLVHRHTPRTVRAVVIACLVPLLINLLFTFTRSAWLGFVVGVLVIGLVRAPRLIAVLAVAVGLVFLLSTPEMREARFSSLIDPGHPHNLTRLHMWRMGWRCFLDHPLFGIGDIGTEVIWERYAEPGWGTEGHLHNNIMMWLVTLGAVGLLALVALFVRAWHAVATIEKKLRSSWFGGSLALGGLAVQAGFHVAGLFEWNFGDAEIIMLLWASLGLTLAMGRLAETAASSPPVREAATT